MSHPCVVLFGVHPVTADLAAAALGRYGVQTVVPPRQEYNRPLGAFVGEETFPLREVPPFQGAFPEPMVLLCRCGEKLEQILACLGGVQLGRDVLKAVLTEYNRCWNAPMLLRELRRERESIEGSNLR